MLIAPLVLSTGQPCKAYCYMKAYAMCLLFMILIVLVKSKVKLHICMIPDITTTFLVCARQYTCIVLAQIATVKETELEFLRRIIEHQINHLRTYAVYTI